MVEDATKAAPTLPKDTLWDEAQLRRALACETMSGRHWSRVKQSFPRVLIPVGGQRAPLIRWDPAEVRAALEGMKTARPAARRFAARAESVIGRIHG